MYKKQKSADINRIKKVCSFFVHFTDPQILLARQGDLFHYLIILISRSKILDFPAYLDPAGLPECTPIWLGPPKWTWTWLRLFLQISKDKCSWAFDHLLKLSTVVILTFKIQVIFINQIKLIYYGSASEARSHLVIAFCLLLLLLLPPFS